MLLPPPSASEQLLVLRLPGAAPLEAPMLFRSFARAFNASAYIAPKPAIAAGMLNQAKVVQPRMVPMGRRPIDGAAENAQTAFVYAQRARNAKRPVTLQAQQPRH